MQAPPPGERREGGGQRREEKRFHMIQEARDFTVSEGHGHPLVVIKGKNLKTAVLRRVALSGPNPAPDRAL